MNHVDKKDMYAEIAERLNVSYLTVKSIAEFQFKELSLHIHEVKEEDFLLKYIGKVVQKSKPEVDKLKDFEF